MHGFTKLRNFYHISTNITIKSTLLNPDKENIYRICIMPLISTVLVSKGSIAGSGRKIAPPTLILFIKHFEGEEGAL